jgi:hypothetical protein
MRRPLEKGIWRRHYPAEQHRVKFRKQVEENSKEKRM